MWGAGLYQAIISWFIILLDWRAAWMNMEMVIGIKLAI